MTISITRTVAPAVAVLTTAEAKLHCRIDHTTDDTLIDAFIAAATSWCEEFCGRQFVNATYQMKLDNFPPYQDTQEKYITLYYPPVSSITSITYVDSAGTTQTWDSSLYQTDIKSAPPRIAPAYLETWPSDSRTQFGAVTVTYIAGYGAAAANVPDGIKVAVRMLVAHLYENREATTDIALKEVPLGIKALLHPFYLPKIPRG